MKNEEKYKNKQLTLFPEFQNNNEVVSKDKNDVRTGDAGQKVVEAILQKHGYNSCRAPEGLAYDTFVEVKEIGNSRILRVQTKTKSKATPTMHYTFNKGYHRSYTGSKPYDKDDFDIACCVNLQDFRVLFTPGVTKSVSWKRDVFLRNNSDIESWESSIKQIKK